MHHIWSFLRGYVLVKVTGLSVERFVNIAAHNGVYMWDVIHEPDGILMKVSTNSFKRLKDARKKTKSKLRIISKTGAPFFLFRYRKRKLLFGGVLFFLFAIYFLSSFIWRIDIEGTDRLENEALLNMLKREGLTVGAFKAKIRPNNLENTLLAEFADISWVNIHIKGTRAHITLTEILPKQPKLDKNTPCNVIAKKSGVITKIATSAGTPLKSVGDMVQIGEALVSSEIIIKQDESGTIKQYVHADSEVWARVTYEINFTLPYQYIEKQYTGKTKKAYDFVIFGKKISFINIDNYYTNYDKITSSKQLKLGEDYPLPIIVIKKDCREFTPITKRYTALQAREAANRMVNSRIIREFDFEADIIDKQVGFSNGSEGLQATAIITTIERIDVQEQQEFINQIVNE